MTIDNLIDDRKYKNKCISYGLNYEDYFVIDGLIVVNSPKSNISVLFDEHYNTVGVVENNRELDNFEKRIKGYQDLICNTYLKLPYPFEGYSLKQLIDLSNRITIHETNHGHSSYTIVNSKFVKDDNDSVYLSLIAYVKYLGMQIENYFINSYQMKMLGFDCPDIYTYLNSLVTNINECVDVNLENGIEPKPLDVNNYLGRGGLDEDNNYKLQLMINLLSIDKSEQDTIDISGKANQLLRILDISDEEVESRYQESTKTYEIKEINIQALLDNVDKKDNPCVLEKIK